MTNVAATYKPMLTESEFDRLCLDHSLCAMTLLRAIALGPYAVRKYDARDRCERAIAEIQARRH